MNKLSTAISFFLMPYKCVVCCCCWVFFLGGSGGGRVNSQIHMSCDPPPHPDYFFYQMLSNAQVTSLTASSSWRFLSSSIWMAIRRSFSRLCRSSTSLAASACTAKHSHSHHLPDICRCVIRTHLIHKHATVKFTTKRSSFFFWCHVDWSYHICTNMPQWSAPYRNMCRSCQEHKCY